MAEVPSSNPASSNGIVSDSAQSVSIGIIDAEEARRDNLLVTKPPLSPVPTHPSQFSHRTSASSTLPRVPPTSSRTSPPIGAVASLAISGGMSQDELLRLGQNRPLPVSIRSTRAAAVVLRGGGVRGGPRRGHHTAPPGTVHIGRVTRVARCDICLSPPSSALCSFNPSPRGSPLHLTRVGGIIADTNDRKSSLPVLPTDQLVRVGPGTVVSTRGQSYARINWYPQPYKSASIEATSTSISPPLQALPNPPSVSGVQVESAISSQVSMLSDGTDIAESSGRAPISPDGHSTSSVEVPMRNLNLGSCPIPSTSEEAVHFFGSSYTASTADSTTVTATTSTMTAFDAVVHHSPPKGETTYQQRLYHQHIARSVRNLRRFRHIYGDSLTSVLASTKAPSSEERENSTSSIPSMQHRRSSADEALIARAVGERDEPSSPPSPPPSSAKLVSNLEQRRRRRHLFISHRSVHSESQRQAGEAIPVATVIVALESDENTKPSKSLWLHRRCFVYNGCIFLISLTENVTSVLSTKSKPSRSPPSLCEGSWSHSLSNCDLTWSDVAAMDLRSIANCGLLQSGQLYPICCTFRVREEKVSNPDYTCRMYFLQQDQRLEAVIADLKGLPSESSSSQKTTSDTNRTPISSLLNSGQSNRGSNLGVAGPPGGFPLMVAAETLAASFGVHMNRSQAGILDPTSRITLKKTSSGASKSGSSYSSLQSPHDSPSPTPDVGSSHHKSSLLRSTFARMRQVAMGGTQVNSSTTTPSATITAPTSSSSSSFLAGTSTSTPSASTSSRSAFHQRLSHFSQTFAHDKCSPRRRKLNQIHRSYQSCQSPHPSDMAVDSEASFYAVESRDKRFAQLHLPLTAVLEPNNSFLQSIGDEVPVSANELAVTMPMQLAVVDAAMVAASGGTSTCVEAAGAGVGRAVQAGEADHEEYGRTALMQQSHLPVEHSTGKGIESTSTIRSISVSTEIMNTSHSQKEFNTQTTRRLLRRPTDPNMSIESEPGDFQEAVLLDPPILHPERSLVGSLPLHQCARSTFSAFVPFVVELCVTLVEKFGLNCVGIYRVSGNKLAHDFMAAELCKQLGDIDATNEKWNDIHALACVLKTLLRNLPDSLIPKVMYPEFLAASRVESWERRLLSVQRLLSIMECYPKHPEYRVHRATLRYLATHLARVASRQAVNRMTAYNLALVFAPNLIQSNEDSPELFIADSKFKIWLLETIIKYHKWVFSPDLGLESGCFVPEDSDKVLLTDEALAEAMAASSSGVLQDFEFANQPGRSEGDVRPVLQEMLHAAALLPPPPSTSDLEVAEEPGPSLDKPTDVATVVEQALESSAVELQEIQQQQQHQQLQQHHQRQRNRPVSQPGGENRSHNQERSLSVGRRREEHQGKDIELITCSATFSPYKEVSDSPERPTLLIIPEDHCDVEREDSSSARMQHLLLTQSPTTAPPSPRISSFNQSLNPSTNNTNKTASSSRWRPFYRQRRHSGGEAPHSKSTMEMAVVGAGEEIYSISHLVAFRRTKSCRRRGNNSNEAREALSESLELTIQEPQEHPQQVRKQSTSPSSSNEPSFRVRHHSLRKWWFH